jgi:ATP-dependent helicase HrpA
VFAPHPGRRIVLATNVAETSLTVPGIRYVVDAGTARISRYSQRTKVQRLPIEPISQASGHAARRPLRPRGARHLHPAVRGGRPPRPPGVHRPGDPAHQPRVGHPADDRARARRHRAFPFVDPPDRRNVKDGVDLLVELGALDPAQDDPRKRLTQVGRTLSQLPVDPRLARMVVEADRNGCVRDVLVIAAALSIQDPRERPQDRQQAAAEQHARFVDEHSDFLAYLNLWRYLQDQQRSSRPAPSAGCARRSS